MRAITKILFFFLLFSLPVQALVDTQPKLKEASIEQCCPLHPNVIRIWGPKDENGERKYKWSLVLDKGKIMTYAVENFGEDEKNWNVKL